MFRFSLTTMLFLTAGAAAYAMMFVAMKEDSLWKKEMAAFMLAALIVVKMRYGQIKAGKAMMREEEEGAKPPE